MFFQRKLGKKIRRVKRDSREIMPQEILLDSLAQKKDYFGQKRFEVPIKKTTVRLFSAFFLLIILILLGQALWLQIFKGQEFKLLAEKNYQRVYFERTERGVIYDRNMKQLVFNEKTFDLGCYKRDFPRDKDQQADIIEIVAKIMEVAPESIDEKISNGKGDRVLLFEDIELPKVIDLRSAAEDLPGFYLKENPKRKYVSGKDFSHIIGFLSRPTEQEAEKQNLSPLDYVGKSGIEKFYENTLRGVKEKWLVEKNVFSQEISRSLVQEKEPGQSLVLTIDSDLQKVSISALEKSLSRTGAGSGAVVVMDPNNGEVLSLVSLPSFDNNIFFRELNYEEWSEILNDPLNPFWNRVVSATYPSGSTIKPLIAVAALEEDVISPQKKIYCEGEIIVENPWFKDKPWVYHDWTSHGWTDMKKAIAESCNVYFYTIGGGYGDIQGLGPEKIKRYLSLFGWGEKSGIDLPGERAGLIPDPNWKKQAFDKKQDQIWVPGDTYNLSIGQGYLSVTPIQVAASFSSLVNGGKLIQPRLVSKIVNENKEIVSEKQPIIKREGFIDAYSAKVAREGMRDAVIYGSSRILSDLPVKAAAKTGTAQTEKKEHYHNWVTVFAPYDDPQIVITVLVEYVPQEQVAALPAAKEILSWYFSR